MKAREAIFENEEVQQNEGGCSGSAKATYYSAPNVSAQAGQCTHERHKKNPPAARLLGSAELHHSLWQSLQIFIMRLFLLINIFLSIIMKDFSGFDLIYL